MTVRRVERGRLYEDFTEGRRFEHPWGRTFTAQDGIQWSALTLHHNPLYFDEVHARRQGYAGLVMNPLLVFSTALGLSVEDLSEAGGTFLGVDDLAFHRPVYAGSTLRARSTVLARRPSASRPGWGVVEWQTSATDAERQPVLQYRRRNLVRMRAGPPASRPSRGGPPPAPRTLPDRGPATPAAPIEGGTYLEDLRAGDVVEHGRGRTVTDLDNYYVTHLTMNTAQVHFNVEFARQMMGGAFGERLVVGPATIAIVVGLTTEDVSEHAFLDLGLTGIILPAPVFAGDTLHARSEILEVGAAEGRDDAGLVRYRFTGFKADGVVVVEGERTILVKTRAAWGARDARAASQREESP